MIVGNGNVAKAIVDNDQFLFFASGVSNSAETRQAEFDREVRLLLDQDAEAHLVYFSSLSVFYSDTPYANHKRRMEGFVHARKRYTIIRLGNLAWDTNPHTIINHLKGKIARGELFEVRDVYRYVISKEEFQHWLSLIPWWNCEMNCPGAFLKVEEIVSRIKQGTL